MDMEGLEVNVIGVYGVKFQRTNQNMLEKG